MINIQMCKMHAVFINKFKSQIKLYLLKLPDRTSSPSSCISGTACLTICEISLLRKETGKAFCSQLSKFGVAHSEEAEVNRRWISTD